jgi:hypothetical protein
MSKRPARRYTNANSHQLASSPALNKASAMFSLTVKLEVDMKVIVQIIILIISMLS